MSRIPTQTTHRKNKSSRTQEKDKRKKIKANVRGFKGELCLLKDLGEQGLKGKKIRDNR